MDTETALGIVAIGVGAFALYSLATAPSEDVTVPSGGGGGYRIPAGLPAIDKKAKSEPTVSIKVEAPKIERMPPSDLATPTKKEVRATSHSSHSSHHKEDVKAVPVPTKKEIKKMETIAKETPTKRTYFPEYGVLYEKDDKGNVYGYSMALTKKDILKDYLNTTVYGESWIDWLK